MASASRCGRDVVTASSGATERGPVFELQIVFVLAWPFMPVLAGSVAIAEERKLGTVQRQQCLPVSRVRQFLMKLAAVGGVTVLLGLVVPVLVLWSAAWIRGIHLVEVNLEQLRFF